MGQTVNVYHGSKAQSSGKAANTGFSEINEERIRQHCREKILQNYSKIRLLSGQEIGVDQLYVDVWLLDRPPHTFQILQMAKMLEKFDLRHDRLGLGRQIKNIPGFDMANQESKLLILGKPGAGKTTFLKHLAVDWCNGKFQSDLIAVFIEFRQIRDKKWELLKAIGEELKIHDEKQVEVLLSDGKLLVIMDGFDEVLTQELRTKVQAQLEKATKDYSKSRYIMTCRTQIMQGIPDGFASVEVADFNIDQVQAFVCNWFQANGQNEDAVKDQWQNFKLSIDRNPALKELTVTSVLLGLMCLVLQDEGEIPAQIGLLYKRGIRLLLEKWNDEKRINGWEIGTEEYQKLDVEKKEELLIKIAVKKFEDSENFILFDQGDLIEQISQHLRLSNRGDAYAVLKSIESQHGLLVERADELWSFSHLTFQEYFTTKWLLSLSLEDLSQKISDKRWQEVVPQLVKSQGQSDQLVQLIKQSIDYCMATHEKSQKFIVWVREKAGLINAPYKSAVIRLFCLAMDFDPDFASDRDLARERSIALDRVLALALDPDLNFDRALDLADALNFVLDFARDLNFDRAFSLYCVFNFDCDADQDVLLKRDRIRAIARTIDSQLVNKLEKLRSKFLISAKGDDFEKWWIVHSQVWKEQLIQTIVEHRDFTCDWQLTDEQQQHLWRYYDASKFLFKLLQIENAISPEARQEIEDNLLLPIAELKRRLPEQYGGIEEG